MNSKRTAAFRKTVWAYYKKNGRNGLPWRKTKDSYRILVSEMMLQQTQVPRVIGKYEGFLKKFPTVRKLAAAEFSDVLKVWSGLGYNRRAKYLHDAAKRFKKEGIHNKNAIAFLLCRGIGPYTRDAVRVFAFNEPRVLLETNIRTAFIHHFYRGRSFVSDEQIQKIAEEAARGQDSRTWHWALMDYGAYLKRSGVRNNHRSAHYTKQSKFEGSLRQIRGAILRQLHRSDSISMRRLIYRGDASIDSGLLRRALAGLERDGLIVKEKGKWRIA